MEIEVSAAARRDLTLIYNHLMDSFEGFGCDPDTAERDAGARLDAVFDAIQSLSKVPYQGTLHDDILPGLRHVTKGAAILWFIPQGDVLRVLAIFYRGQDHLRHMRSRLDG